MAIATSPRDYLADLARRLDSAGHGAKSALKAEACGFLGISLATLHSRLQREVGWSSGRKPRADKGSSRVSDDALLMVASTQREAIRKNDKQILFTPDSAQILEANGVDLPVSNGHLNRLMRIRKINVAAQRQAKAVVSLKSLHPNHVHQVDPSLCVLYYLPNGQQAMMEADKFYKNKLDNYSKIKLKVWRYVLYDHTTAVITARYFETAGENAGTLFEFLAWAWSRQIGREFHGVPKILMWDKGSANTSAPIKSLLKALEVEPIEHAPGAANVKGGVENANNIVECKFESRLKFEPVRNVDELNAACLAWQNAFNADLIPRQDNRLKRQGADPIARYDLWRRIRADELRLLPDVEVCRALLAGGNETRKVSRKLEISYRHPQSDRSRVYKVDGLAGIVAGDTVTLQPLLFGDCALRISLPRFDGADLVYRLEPEALPDENGFAAGAIVIGEEYRVLADTSTAKAVKQMDALAYPGRGQDDIVKARERQEAPFGGHLNAHSHLADIVLPTALPRRGIALSVPGTVEVEEKPLSPVQVAAWCASHVRDWDSDKYRQLMSWYPQGVKEADLAGVAERFRTTLRLVAVGGA